MLSRTLQFDGNGLAVGDDLVPLYALYKVQVQLSKQFHRAIKIILPPKWPKTALYLEYTIEDVVL